jgi:threonine dehydratase
VRLALTSRVYDMVAETPLQYASGLSARLGANVHLKREDLLPSFSFKLRGAYNLLAHCEERDVITYSVGSQGLSVAVAARALGIRATVVMPERTPLKRRLAIEREGASVVIAGRSLAEAEAYAIEQSNASPSLALVQPHDHHHVIAGQATAALETIKQIGPALEGTPGPDGVTTGHDRLDAIFVVGGGARLAIQLDTNIHEDCPVPNATHGCRCSRPMLDPPSEQARPSSRAFRR